MIYEYICSVCQEVWEDNQTIDNREKPCRERCPHCKAENSVSRAYNAPPALSSDGGKGIQTRTPNWMRDRLKNIKKYSPGPNTINVK